MQALHKARGVTAALILAAGLALAACNQNTTTSTETSVAPTDAEREAGMAAEQLAALGGPADAATQALYQGDFQASGSLDSGGGSGEGAWELSLLNDYAQLVRPGLGQDGGVPGPREFHAHGMRVIAGDLTISIMAQNCPLPNGQALPYVANVLFEGVSYQGCARRGAGDAIRATWASVLPELLPAIDACLTRVTAKPARITTASALDEGQVSVRIREADGTRHDCVADSAGSGASVYDSVSDLDRRSGESDPEFQRTGAQPRAGRCQAVEEAKNATGEHIGWLLKKVACQ